MAGLTAIDPRQWSSGDRLGLLDQLAPFEKITEPSAAPSGSRIRSLYDAAERTAAERKARETDATALRVRLAAAQERLAKASLRTDYAGIAAARGELAVVREAAEAADAARDAAAKAADEAERALGHAWGLVQDAKVVLRQMIERGVDSRYRYQSRSGACWEILGEHLEVRSETRRLK